jgi:hypothetical protein
MKIRKLKPEEVEFTLDVEPECDMPVKGNAMCSGDDEADKEYEQELLARLERGDTAAWCVLIVRAKWKSLEGVAALGGVTLLEDADEEKAWEMANWHGMKGEALASLNSDLQGCAEMLAELQAE